MILRCSDRALADRIARTNLRVSALWEELDAGHDLACSLAHVYVAESFDEAKRVLIADLLFAADYAETGDIGDALALAAEEVNLWNGPDTCYVEMIDSEHCIPTAWWIVETDEAPETED